MTIDGHVPLPPPPPPTNGVKKWVPVAALAVNSILVPAWGWVATEIIDIRKWQAATNANRFTSDDGRAVYREIAEIHKEIAKLPKEVPPAWFLGEVRNLAGKLDRQDSQLHAITERLAKIEEKVNN